MRRHPFRGVTMLVIEQPDGTMALVPEWMTRPAAAAVEIRDAPRFPLAELRALRQVVVVAARMIVEFPGGNKVLFGGSGGSAGLSEVARRDDIAKATGDQFKKALASLTDITSAVEQSMDRMAHRPETVEIEFRASLTAECDLWIISGEGEAEFKITLAWGKVE